MPYANPERRREWERNRKRPNRGLSAITKDAMRWRSGSDILDRIKAKATHDHETVAETIRTLIEWGLEAWEEELLVRSKERSTKQL